MDPLKERAAWAINSAVRNPTRQSQTTLSAHILDFSRKFSEIFFRSGEVIRQKHLQEICPGLIIRLNHWDKNLQQKRAIEYKN